ncbi:MAG: FAD:protein FMN transferase [Deltaproteobacteria bacterium]|nr:FAD:protein FMN transferase [Deltaproteobacteria bacterium]MBN2673078.1 FAD:protein FMN transferase [Deltaproteobacteria bacterium]
MTKESKHISVRMWQKISAVLLVAALALLLKWLNGEHDEFETLVFSGNTMATTYHIKVVRNANDVSGAESLANAIQQQLETVNRQMSRYYEGGDIYRLNAAGAGMPVSVAADVITVLQRAIDISELTDGAFDVTVGPLIHVWGFHDKVPLEHAPTDAQIEQAKARVGYSHLVLDIKSNTVTKQIQGLDVDLSAIAKGRAVDLVAELLEKRGEKHYMVEVGGEIRCKGYNDKKQLWKIGIEKPAVGENLSRQISRVVALNDMSLATSGDYRSFYMLNGERMSHTINPRTGKPIQHHLASVSVFAADCMSADALATAFTVLGASEGMKLADKQHIAAYFIERSGDAFVETSSKVFAQQFASTKEN